MRRRSSPPATSRRRRRALAGLRARRAPRRSTAGRPTCSARARNAYDPPPWRRSRVDFLGCKVSHADVHEMREALLARRPRRERRGGDVAVINTCCVTNEAVAKSRKAAARAARTHARVYVTGCAANLPSDAFAGPARQRHRRRAARARRPPAFVAGDVGAIGCVQADARLDRVRAFVKIQDGCSFSCNFCVIPLVRGAIAQPQRRRGARARSGGASTQGHREVVLTGINLGCFRDRAAGYDLRAARPRGGRDARARAAAAQLDRDQPRQRRARRGAARDADRRAAPARSAAVGRRRRAARDGAPLHGRARTCARLEPLADEFNLTTDVIVGFPAEDERGVRARRCATVERAGHHEGARLPVLAAARAR